MKLTDRLGQAGASFSTELVVRRANRKPPSVYKGELDSFVLAEVFITLHAFHRA